MSPEFDSQEGQLTSDEHSLVVLDYIHRISIHRILGSHNVRLENVIGEREQETYKRLHAPSEPISQSSIEELAKEVDAAIQQVDVRQGVRSQDPKASYLLGLQQGFKKPWSPTIFPSVEYVDNKSLLIERLAKEEVNLMYSNYGVAGDEIIINPFLFLGRVVAIEKMLGRRPGDIIAEIPPMPEYLKAPPKLA